MAGVDQIPFFPPSTTVHTMHSHTFIGAAAVGQFVANVAGTPIEPRLDNGLGATPLMGWSGWVRTV